MIIESIKIKEGLLTRKIDFSNGVNLIHSEKNSVGKSTLLRLILYGMGYDIPSTRGLNFEKCEVTLMLKLDSGECIRLLRYNKSYIDMYGHFGGVRTYVLPASQDKIGTILYKTSNIDLLNNMLGVFYMDQDKGWTLLNRGKVIGHIAFQIEGFLRGLSDIDCAKLLEQRSYLKQNIDKYKTLENIALYRNTLMDKKANRYLDEDDRQTKANLASLEVQLNSLRERMYEINAALENNRSIKELISKMKLLIKSPAGEIFQLESENIVGLDDSIQILLKRHLMLGHKVKQIEEQLISTRHKMDLKDNLPKLFEVKDQVQEMDEQIVGIPMDYDIIHDRRVTAKKKLKEVEDKIKLLSQGNSTITKYASDGLIKYAKELGLEQDGIPITPGYLFTSNLKQLSGAVLHKMAFAFRLAYINTVFHFLNVRLPIILDSPRGKELDKLNVEIMMRILKRDYAEHQIILASIFKYDAFQGECHDIELKNRLLES